MIVRMLIDGLLSLGRPVRPATMRLPLPSASRQRRTDSREPAAPFRGRPDLMLVTGAMSAPSAIPARITRPRPLSGGGGRRAA